MKLRISRKAFVLYLRANLDTAFFQDQCRGCALARATGQRIEPDGGKGVDLEELPGWAAYVSELRHHGSNGIFDGREILQAMVETP